MHCNCGASQRLNFNTYWKLSLKWSKFRSLVNYSGNKLKISAITTVLKHLSNFPREVFNAKSQLARRRSLKKPQIKRALVYRKNQTPIHHSASLKFEQRYEDTKILYVFTFDSSNKKVAQKHTALSPCKSHLKLRKRATWPLEIYEVFRHTHQLQFRLIVEATGISI